jgi:hypothetical protein
VGLVQASTFVLFAVATEVAMPVFERIHRQFEANMPGVTTEVLHAAERPFRFWLLALPLVCLWPFVNYGVVSLLLPRVFRDVLAPRRDVATASRLWYIASWLAIALLVAFVLYALILPMIRMGNLSQS